MEETHKIHVVYLKSKLSLKLLTFSMIMRKICELMHNKNLKLFETG